jgi:hypothetical protein
MVRSLKLGMNPFRGFLLSGHLRFKGGTNLGDREGAQSIYRS